MGLFKRPPDDTGSVWYSVVIGVFVAFGGFLFGYDTGTISGIIVMNFWQSRFSTGFTDVDGNPDLSPAQSSLVVSILSGGTFVGALLSPLLADKLGRRWGLIISAWVFNVGVLMQVISVAIPLFAAGRFFAGLGVGLLSALGEYLFCKRLDRALLTLLNSPPLPIRDRSQMDPWVHCGCISTCHHHRHPSRGHCQQCHS